MKRFFCLLLSFVMVLGILPISAFAGEVPAGTEVSETVEETTVPTEPAETIPLPDLEGFIQGEPILVDGREMSGDELFAGYVESVFYSQDQGVLYSTGDESAGSKLTGDEKKVYDALVPIIKKIASGERASTIINISPYSAEAPVTFTGSFDDLDVHLVTKALTSDHPYEMYWASGGWSYSWSPSSGTLQNFTLRIQVAANYRGGDEFTTNTTKTAATVTAANNAKAIANKYAGKSDYDKICGFRDEICALVCYDYDAAENDTSSINNSPWQLINVFDKDPDTNIVCAGYAKAFQYLCDLSGLTCYYVTGYTNGYHAWNIVTLEGKNYLVDLTNTDDCEMPGYVMFGFDGCVFLAGSSNGSASAGYTFTNSYGSDLTYQYDAEMFDLWGTGILTLSSASYSPCSHTYTSKVTKQPTEYETGIRTYTCSKCGSSYTETIAKLKHIHKYSPVVTAPTCTQQGYTTYTCRCGDTYKADYTDPAVHTEVIDPAMEATCQKTGLTEGSHCSVCGEVLTAQKVAPIVDHSYVNHRCKWCGLIGGYCGDELVWRLDDTNGILYIQGTGTMYDYSAATGNQPWAEFAGQITRIVIESGAEDIGDAAFAGLANLTNVTIPSSVTSLGISAFSGCTALVKTVIPSSVTQIGNLAFQNCTSLSDLTLSSGLTSIGAHAFQNCTSLAQISLPGTVTELGSYAFADCAALTKITLPKGITVISEALFHKCTGLTEVSLPSGITAIGDRAFYGCSALTQIDLPGKVTGIGSDAFYGCAGLTELTVPAGVESIGFYAFAGCDDLSVFRFLGDAPAFEELVFHGITAVAYYPTDNATWTDDVKQQYGGNITWVEQTGTVDEYSGICGDDLTWKYDSESATLTISGTGDMYDYETDKLNQENWTYTATHPWQAFAPLIQYVVIEGGAASIGDLAFYECTSLKQVTIPDSVTDLGSQTFFDCIRLNQATIPEGVTAIGQGTFWGCSALTGIHIPETVTTIGNQAFAFTGLTEVTVPANVETVGALAFEYCSDLNSITFTGNAPAFGNNVFYSTSSIAYYPGDDDTWTTDVRQDYGGDIRWVPVGGAVSLGVTRISGKDRLQTAFTIADKLKAVLGVDRFSSIIIASGDTFADALAGSYLAAVKNAPILLSRGGDADNLDYIQENLSDEGIVYILGGTAAVPQSMEDLLIANNISYERIKGKTRLDTNIEILKKAGINGDEILVATGWNFADSLSASATGKPILMVNNNTGTLTANQKAYLNTLGYMKFTIIGGTGAVSDQLAIQLDEYGDVTRIYGRTREDTSVKVAQACFHDPSTALLAYSRNFPDGLCGGPLAYALGAPLLLTKGGAETSAAQYVSENPIRTGYILGGVAAVSDESAMLVFGLDSADDIQ